MMNLRILVIAAAILAAVTAMSIITQPLPALYTYDDTPSTK
ncbi:hypothetical protein [Erwinia persicina]|nr:hypothetical protein [Erwinia persicina]